MLKRQGQVHVLFFPQLQMWESESLFLSAYTLQQSHFLFCVLRACIYTCPESTDITAEIFFCSHYSVEAQ